MCILLPVRKPEGRLGQFRVFDGYRYQAHLQVSELYGEYRLNGQDFADLHNQPIQNIFKPLSMEWIWEEAFSQYIHPQTQWIEPCWKMLLSNKSDF